MILTKNIPSGKFSGFGKSRQRIYYGHSGDKVTVISERGNMLIVENEKKERFPVKAEDVQKNIRETP
jgi:hypothetical protein